MATSSDSVRRARPLLGTFVEIEVTGAALFEMEAAVDAAFKAVASVHRLMSFHEADSDVGRLNREACLRPTKVHPWTFEVLEAALELHRRSNGVFDVAVAPILQAMGLLPLSADDPPASTGPLSFDAIELVSRQAVRFRHPNVRIDLGGIAKGFAVDRALETLRHFNISAGIVNAGGDLAVFGPDSQMIHIRDPRNPGRPICSVEIADHALASTARRFDLFQRAETRASAVIDPASRMPVRSIDGATVRAPCCMIADALTKIVMVAGTEAIGLLEQYNANALLISADGDIHITPDWHHAVHLAA